MNSILSLFSIHPIHFFAWLLATDLKPSTATDIIVTVTFNRYSCRQTRYTYVFIFSLSFSLTQCFAGTAKSFSMKSFFCILCCFLTGFESLICTSMSQRIFCLFFKGTSCTFFGLYDWSKSSNVYIFLCFQWITFFFSSCVFLLCQLAGYVHFMSK